jgi:DNA-binding transcriptional LysR family regulator
MPEPLKLRRLEHLVLLSEGLNFARAAERACLSPSAFSRSIQALEESLGMALVERTPRYVQLTPAGLRLASRARQLIASTTELQRELDMLRRGDLGEVAVGADPFSAVALFPQALAALNKEYPAIIVRLEVDNSSALLQRLRAEKLDFFVSDIREIAPVRDLSIKPLGTFEGSLYCRAGHPLLRDRLLELPELARASFASVYMPDIVRRELLALLAPHSWDTLPVVLECENALVTREFVLRTDAVMVAFPEAIRVELNVGALRELPVRQLLELGSRTPMRSEIALVKSSDRIAFPASELLLESIVGEAGSRLATRAKNASSSA